MEIGEKSKVGLSPDSHNAWEPAQDAGFHIPPATAAAGTMKVNTAEPLESRGCSDSCTEPVLDKVVVAGPGADSASTICPKELGA